MDNLRRIGFNGRFLSKKNTGIGRYSLNLLKYLSALMVGKNLEMIVVVNEKIDLNLPNIKVVIVPEIKSIEKFSKGLAKSYWEKVQIAKIFETEKVEIIHIPYPALLPSGPKVPTIVTVHDAIPWTNSEYLTASKLGGIYNQRVLKELIKSTLILTVSERSRQDILGLAELSKKQMVVTYNGCDIQKNDGVENIKVLNKYGINDGNYIFYLGGFDSRKNVLRTLEIFELVADKRPGLKLVLGGKKILNNKLFEEHNLIIEKLKNSALGERVIMTGEIEENDLNVLYSSGLAMINLSKAEGFNLNIVEALSCGTPILVSDIAVHREIVGGAGEAVIWFKLEENNQEMAEKIVDLLANSVVYNSSKQAALAYKCPYLWEDNAKKVLEIYQTFLI